MSGHTPGPWQIDEWGVGAGTDRGAYTIEPLAEPGIVICGRSEWDHRAEESRANARLIAAAPRGLSTAEFAYSRLLMLPHDSTRLALQPVLCELRDYIAEATGRTSRDVQDEYEAKATGVEK